MQAQIIEQFKKWNIDSRDRLLLGFSGGLDSRVLLELLLELGYQVSIAHCNFKLRGPTADQDEQFCRDLAFSKNIQGYFTEFPTEIFAKENGLSIQMAARTLRYQYFEKVQKTEGFRAVLTAHHADDQIETILFKLARGSALEGVSGIPEQRGIFLRPLLGVFREELEAYAKDRNLSWREDESNLDDKYLRNAYRHHLIPAWQGIQEDFKEKLLLSNRLLKEQNASLKELLQEKLDANLQVRGDEEHLYYQKLKNKSYWKQLLFHWLGGKGNWDWKAVERLPDSKKGKFTFIEGWILAQDHEFLRLSPRKNFETVTELIEAKDKEVNGAYFHLEIEEITKEHLKIEDRAEYHYFDHERLKFPLLVRNWKEGDKFQPLGMKGKKKVSDYLIDRKIPSTIKAQKLVLESDGHIIAVLGERIDHRYRVQNSSKTIYFVRFSYTNITS